jgi:UPF0148 protein
MSEKPDDIKRMADLLRQGATLTDLSCPACASPLFRFKNGKLWCVKDQKEVVLVKEGEQPEKRTGQTTANPSFDSLETTLMTKVQDLQNKIQQTDNIEELQKLSTALSELLGNIEKIKRIRNS